MKSGTVYVILSFVFLLLYVFGLFVFMTDYEENRCNMTYMFEYPQLVRISLPGNASTVHRKYGLYAYSEGRYTEKARSMKFNGIPVLFIPGNRGSPKQVRSLASVSLRKALSSRAPHHFDYFTLDLNEEYSALFGGFLNQQTDFLKRSVAHILTLYRGKDVPESVVLIGHSMGGLLAKGLFLEPDFNRDTVRIIITLATPHSPALLIDSHLHDYYSRVNSYWALNWDILKEHLNLISIGGGPRDLLVRGAHTDTPHSDLNIVAPEIPEVWLSVDHLCILWCKQLVLVVVRSLFDCVDPHSKQISDNVLHRREVFNYHLIERSGSKHYSPFLPEVTFYSEYNNETATWIPMSDTTLTWSANRTPKPTYITVSLGTASDTLVVRTENHKTRDWIFACVFDTSVIGTKTCKTGNNLSNKVVISPTDGVKRKTATVDLSHLRMSGHTHVVVRTLPTNEFVQIHLDLFKKRSRAIVGETNYFPNAVILPRTQPGALYYAIDMIHSQRLWQSYKVIVETDGNCSETSEVRITAPWSHSGSTHLIRGPTEKVPVVLASPKPPSKEMGDVKVHVFIDPKCTYKFKLEFSIPASLAAVTSHWGISILSLSAVSILLTLAYQINLLQEESRCPWLLSAMRVAAKPYVVIQATAITSAIVQHLAPFISWLPTTDIKGNGGLVEMLLIPVTMYLAAFSLTALAGHGIILAVIFQGQAYYNGLLKFLNKFLFGLSWLSEYVMSGANKVPIVISAFMITVAYSACGGLAVTIGLGFYFFKMVSLYDDFWEEVLYYPLRVLKAKLKQRRGDKSVEIPQFRIPPADDFHFHLTLMLLWSVATVVYVPSVLTWAKNYRYNNKLEPDPTLVTSIVFSLCAGVLWQADVPKTGLVGSKYLSRAIFGAAVFTMTFAQTSIYRIPPTMAAVFVMVTLHQIIAPWFTPTEETTPQTEDKTETEPDANDSIAVEEKADGDGDGDNTPSSEGSSSFERISELSDKDLT